MGTESEDLIINLLFDRIPTLWNKNGVLFINFNYFSNCQSWSTNSWCIFAWGLMDLSPRPHMEVPWYYHGSTVVLPWWKYRGTTMVIPYHSNEWYYHGTTIVLLR